MGQVQTRIKFEGQQAEALEKIRRWVRAHANRVPGTPQKFVLFGFAGSGKSTLAGEVARHVPSQGVCLAGKAAIEMSHKGIEASTIHSFCYRPNMTEEGLLLGYNLRDKPENPINLIIPDECGMINTELDNDLMSFGLPMLVMGDPFQLPPVEGTSPYEGIKPDYQLTDIVRQAKDNPVIMMSMTVREGRDLKIGRYGDSRVITKAVAKQHIEKLIIDHQGDSKIIVGRNITRTRLNRKARRIFEFKSEFPEMGETLICLKNERSRGLFNGQIWEVADSYGPIEFKCHYMARNYRTGEQELRKSYWGPDEPGPTGHQVTVQCVVLTLSSQDDPTIKVEVAVPTAYFNGNPDELHWKQKVATSAFDFGYVLTCHKAQGSTFRNVFVFDEGYIFGDMWSRWRYSAMTRPSGNLIMAI